MTNKIYKSLIQINIMIKKLNTTITKQTDHLTVNFEQAWFQEDIDSLSEQLFTMLAGFKIQEKILGADRENIRFCWQAHYFILNFDCCSQSCWLEGQDEASSNYLDNLYLELSK